VTKLIYTVEHILLSTEANFPVTIGVRVVLFVMSKWWLSDEMGENVVSFPSRR